MVAPTPHPGVTLTGGTLSETSLPPSFPNARPEDTPKHCCAWSLRASGQRRSWTRRSLKAPMRSKCQDRDLGSFEGAQGAGGRGAGLQAAVTFSQTVEDALGLRRCLAGMGLGGRSRLCDVVSEAAVAWLRAAFVEMVAG